MIFIILFRTFLKLIINIMLKYFNMTRTFNITYDSQLLENSSGINIHIGITGLRVEFAQLDLDVTHNNGDESSRVFLPNYNNVSGNPVSFVHPLQGRPYVSQPPAPSPADILELSPLQPLRRQQIYEEVWNRPILQEHSNANNISGFWDQSMNFPQISGNSNVIFSSESNQENYEQFINHISIENMGDEDDIDNKCSICLNQMTEETIHTTGCNHSFHRQCLDIWENNHSSCPLCRANLHNYNVNE